MTTPILIVAYGNPLRCDDGIAWRAADELKGKCPESEVEILRFHQLAPEVADAIRNRQLVLFLDAACVDDVENSHAGEIRVRDISNNKLHRQREGQFSHVYSPTKIVELARELYDATPKAFVITVAGESFSHGECVSTPVASALPELIGTVKRMIETEQS